MARSRHPKTFINVDFPEPEGPIIARNSLGMIAKEIPCKASTSTLPVVYIFLNPVTCINLEDPCQGKTFLISFPAWG